MSDPAPIYLRTDLVFGLASGGSVAHITGVFNWLDHFTAKPVMFTSDFIRGLRNDLEVYTILPGAYFVDDPELAFLNYNECFEQKVLRLLGRKRVSFIYQRYSTNNYAGVRLAKRLGVPFILEFNGSEVWANQAWRQSLKYVSISESIEKLNLLHADLIVVVSDELKEWLVQQGIGLERILVNPNGVDPARYAPTIDGSAVRTCLGLAGKTVIGFIGTFEAWHGVELLVDAFRRLLHEKPSYRASSHLLLIGDGPLFASVKNQIAESRIAECCTLVGRVAQEQAPVYLAACDILVSPTLPNKDGSPFFGSPTKLFEYMAMGRGIVASDLNQLGQILRHDQSAWLTKPVDVHDLQAGLQRLIDDVERRTRLGVNARADVVARYTWREHVHKIVRRINEACPAVEGIAAK